MASSSDPDTEPPTSWRNDVLAHQPAPILSFLLQTAILDSFNVGLCEAVIAGEDSTWSARSLHRFGSNSATVHNRSRRSTANGIADHQIYSQRPAGSARHGRAKGPIVRSALQHRAAHWYAQQRPGGRGSACTPVPAGDRELAARCIAQGSCVRAQPRRIARTLERWPGLWLRPNSSRSAADLLDRARLQPLFSRGDSGALARAVAHAAALLEGRNQHDLYRKFERGTVRGCVAVSSAVGAYFSC